jgi:hypothetical protein
LAIGGGGGGGCELEGVTEVTSTYRVAEMHVCGARGAGGLPRCSASRPICLVDEVQELCENRHSLRLKGGMNVVGCWRELRGEDECTR